MVYELSEFLHGKATPASCTTPCDETGNWEMAKPYTKASFWTRLKAALIVFRYDGIVVKWH